MQLPDHQFYNCVVTLDDGTQHKLDANWLHNSGNDTWQGYSCDAGVTRINITADGSVYGGRCFNDFLGNIDTGWKLLEAPTICKRARCTGCTDDLLVNKEIKNVV